MRYVIILVFSIFALEGMGSVIFHHDIYDARKKEEKAAFQEYAIPLNGDEIDDRSYEKFKSIVIEKEYQVDITQEELEKNYQDRLENAGWKRVKIEKGIGYSRGNLIIKIYIHIPKVKVRLMYTGEDDDM